MAEQTSNDEGQGQGAGTGADAGGKANGDAGGGVAWFDGLGEDLKTNANVTRYATPEDAARALVHFNGHFGVPENQLLRLPKPDDADGNAALWNRLGRPDAPDKYGVELPEASPLDKDALSAFLATMHKAGPFTPGMAKAALDWYAGFDAQVVKDAKALDEAARAKAVETLKGEWGDAYKTRLEEAGAIAQRFGGDELKAFLEETGLGNDPRILKAWSAVAGAMREAGPAPNELGRDGKRPLTPGEAGAELAKIGTDKDSSAALVDANHPQHDYWVQRRLELFAMARPEERQPAAT